MQDTKNADTLGVKGKKNVHGFRMIQVSKYNSIERVIEGHNFIKRGRRWLARPNFARMNG